MAEALSSLSEQLAAAVEQLKSGGGGGGGGWGSDPRSTILRLGGQIVNTAKLPHEQVNALTGTRGPTQGMLTRS